MSMSLGLVIHVAGGTVGLLSGATALFAKKGQRLHRQAGVMFFASMTLMAMTGAVLAFMASVYITVLAGLLTLYLIASSWLTVLPKRPLLVAAEWASSAGGFLVAGFGAFLCWRAANGITDSLGEYSVPAAIYFIFTAIALLALALDTRNFATGFISGKHRIMRHLWRMCVPLYIAASSFFTGQQQVFPEMLQGTIYLSLPEYAVLLLMLFWLVRTVLRRRQPSSATPSASPE